MRHVLAVALLVLVLAGCGGDKPLVKFVNTPPTATLSAEPDTLALSDTSVVTCTVVDPDPDNFTFHWSSRTGRFIRRDPTMSQVSWIAPATEGADTIWVTVFDQADSTRTSVRVVILGQTATIQGAVKDATSEVGLAGARLEIGGRRGTSGSDGSFRLELVPLGVDTLHVSLDGYDPAEQLMAVQGGTNFATVSLRRAVPKARLYGTVTDTLGVPVHGASCRVGQLEDSTDAAGSYDFAAVAAGRQILQVVADGYQTAVDTVEVELPQTRHDVALKKGLPAPPTGQLTVAKLSGFGIRLHWSPQNPPETISGYELFMVVSGENQGSPQPVPGGPLPRTGGGRDVLGTEDGRYRFAVAAVSSDGLVGALSTYTPIAVLTEPSPLVAVPAGAVVMGSYPSDYGNEVHPGNPVDVQGFSIESHEVTNRQFLAYLVESLSRGDLLVTSAEVYAGSERVMLFSASQIDRDPLFDGFAVRPEFRDTPATGVTWFGAAAYAQWLARRLPTESEWEKAARGAADSTGTYEQTAIHVGTRYPWGNAPATTTLANFGGFLGGKRAVASFPAGAALWWDAPIYDLAGNVWEWCDDWYAAYANPHQPPPTGTRKVVRGGAWDQPAEKILVGYRWYLEPELSSPKIGFRCAAGIGQP